ncbi:18466_t:CDS:2, partial [Acaulospora morrowiae]
MEPHVGSNKPGHEKAINIAKKYLAGKIDAECTISQVEEWKKTNAQTAELLSTKLSNKFQ